MGLTQDQYWIGDRDLLTAARQAVVAGVRFESACWGRRGGLRVPEVRTWAHRLGLGAFRRCTAAHGFGNAAWNARALSVGELLDEFVG